MNTFRGEVEINIGGKLRLVKFGTNASAVFSEKVGKDLSELSATAMTVRDLIWAGLVAGARKRKETVDFDEWDVGDWIDEMDEAQFAKVTQTLTNAQPVGDGDPSPKKK